MIRKPFRGVQLNRMHPLAKGLIGCWIFNEATGEIVFDLSGNGNNGIDAGTEWAPIGMQFNGQAVTGVNLIDEIILTGKWTLSFKCRVDNDSHSMVGGSTLDNNNFIWLYGGSYLRFRNNEGNSADFTELTNFADFATYTLTADGSNLILYKNGVYINTISITTDFNINTFGNGYTTGGFTLNGIIQYVHLYSYCLPSAQAMQLYTKPYAMFEPAFNPALLYSAAPPVGAIMNQFQKSNIGADLYNGVFA